MSDAATNPLAWHVGILTAPRPGHPTIGVTLASLSAAGWPIDSVRIFDDPDRSGCYQAWLRGLRLLVAIADCGDDWLLLSEDDAEHSAGLRTYLERSQLNPLAWHSLYCAAELHSEADPGWRAVATPRQCWGSVSYLVTAAVARRLLADPPFPRWRDGTDRAVGYFCQRTGTPYLVHSPSFVRHVGQESSLDEFGGRAVNRQCRAWVRSIREAADGQNLGANLAVGRGVGADHSRAGDRPGAAGLGVRGVVSRPSLDVVRCGPGAAAD